MNVDHYLQSLFNLSGKIACVTGASTGIGRTMALALAKAGATNELFTVPGAGHGNFNAEERTSIYLTIKDFLAKNGL